MPVVTWAALAELVASRPGTELTWRDDIALVDGEEVYPYSRHTDRYALEFEWGFTRVFPAGPPTLRFVIAGCLDDDTEESFAHGYDRPWNGWDQPVVDRETLPAVVATAGDTAILSWGGDTAVINGGGYLVELPPDADGHYLLDMGLTIAAVD